MSDTRESPRAAILLTLLVLTVTASRPQAQIAIGSGGQPLSPLSISSGSPVSDFFRSGLHPPDTITFDSTERPRDSKSSWTAVGLSALLPGAGQVYTENYWKVPLIWGLGGYWVYEWSENNKLYKQYRDQYNQSIADSPPNGDEQLLTLREVYKDQRDSFAWYLGILYFLNVVDAYVGAELYDFDVGPDLGAGGGGVQANLRINL